MSGGERRSGGFDSIDSGPDDVTRVRDEERRRQGTLANAGGPTVPPPPDVPTAAGSDPALAVTQRQTGAGADPGAMQLAFTQPRSRPNPFGIPPTAGSGRGRGTLPQAGSRLGKYEIVSELARGGMGVVYLAKDAALKRTVALKVMLDAGDEDARRRFLREAEAAGRLQHPNVCAVYDAGEQDGCCYFTMELIEGAALNKYVRAGSLGVREILRLFEQVCEGVGFAHMHGVIHRDLKPQNIFVDGRGTAKVMDFGIAKRLGASEVEESLVTLDGAIMGTPSYMSPEQAAGRQDQVDIRSDVYTLGVILFELLVEQLPFRGASLTAILLAVCEQEPPMPRKLRAGLDWEVEAIVLRAMQKRREARYQGCFELKEDIRRYLEGRPIRAKKAGLAYRLRKLVARNPGPAAGAALALAVALGAGLYVLEERRAAAGEQVRLVRARVEEGRDRRREAEGLLEAAARAKSDPAAAREAATLARERFREALALDAANVEAARLEAEAGGLLQEVERRARAFQDEAARRADAERLREELSMALAAGRTALARASALAPTARDASPQGPTATAAAPDGAAEARRRETDEGFRRAIDRASRALEILAEIERDGAPIAVDAERETARALRLEAGKGYATWTLAMGKLDLADYVVDGIRPLDEAEAERLRLAISEAGDDARRLKRSLLDGEAALYEGRDGPAEAALQSALQVDRAHPIARFGLLIVAGRRLVAAGDLARGLASFAAALDVAPEPRHRDYAAREAALCKESAAKAVVDRAEEALAREDAQAALRVLEPALAILGPEPRLEALRARGAALSATPPGFVLIEAGTFPFGPDDAARPVALGAFYIACTEATNAEYREFVAAGGYADERFWPEEARAGRAALVDADGAPGPLEWSKGRFTSGAEQWPVTGISFYEARAYAAFREARLPTEAEWERAVAWRPKERRKVATPEPWAGFQELFRRPAPRPVASKSPEDRSASGVLDGYANAQEWCTNEAGLAATRGGFFQSETQDRARANVGRAPDPWLRSPAIGVRLVKDVRAPEAPR